MTTTTTTTTTQIEVITEEGTVFVCVSVPVNRLSQEQLNRLAHDLIRASERARSKKPHVAGE